VDGRSAGCRSFWVGCRCSWQGTWALGRSHGSRLWGETLVHSLDPDTLLRSDRSSTADPNEVTALFDEAAEAVARDMERAGLRRKMEP